MEPILSVRRLASLLEMSPARLREISRNLKPHYRRDFVRDGDKSRELRIPNYDLKCIQRRILSVILRPIALSGCAHGGVPGCSTRTNAEQHLGRKVVATCDVRRFFPSVRPRHVYRMFRHQFGFGADAASILTRMVTFQGELPQGSPTSTAIANLLLANSVDGPLSLRVAKDGSSFTRFVDDLTFSGGDPTSCINDAGRRLSRLGLRLHRKKAALGEKSKLRVKRNNRQQEVTGLLVNSKDGPSVSKPRRDRIRAQIHHLPQAATTEARLRAEASIRGKIAYVKQFNPGSANRLTRLLLAASTEGNSAAAL